MKTIVVLLSSYNGEKYIESQLDSIINQKVDANVSIVVRDDGSRDGTKEILNTYAEKYTSVKVIEGENIGYIASFLLLLKNAPKSDFYALCDQDDIWKSDKLQCALKILSQEEQEIPLLYGSSSYLVNNQLDVLGETQKPTRDITLFNSMIQNILPGHSQVLNHELVKIINKREYDCTKIYVHDSFITNIALIYGKVVFDNCSHTMYRQYGENQLGYGKSSLNWIKQRIKRIQNNDSVQYARQMEYICRIFKNDMPKDIQDEMGRFFKLQQGFFNRCRYICISKLYRQRRKEDILFKILYLMGEYNIF